MEGAAARETKQFNVALFAAWHTARFALNGYANKGKLAGSKSLADLMLTDDEAAPVENHAQAIAFFHGLKQRGFDVEITRH